MPLPPPVTRATLPVKSTEILDIDVLKAGDRGMRNNAIILARFAPPVKTK
jgi:hypothetical protein